MLNIGFTELLCFAIIALLVLGPEKLPEGARFAAKWYGKIKRFISSVQNEIDQELKLSEFRAEVQKEIERMTELEKRMQQQIDALRQSGGSSTPTQSVNPPTKLTAYHLLNTHIPSPYSHLHLQQHFNALVQMLEAQTTAIELKIAV